ncbi:hypothetical protein AAVH_41774, partial [Aphelenchoides avenae]
WLKWYAHANGVYVKHAHNGGEVRVGKYKLDGLVELPPPLRSIALEFNGCAFHGCPSCYLPETVCPNNKTAGQNYAETQARAKEIEKHYRLHAVWECELARELKKPANDEMKQFFEALPDFGPIRPRDAFFGGRTAPYCFHEDVSNDMEKFGIAYYDVTSLYPFINFTALYPVKHAKVIVGCYDVHWTKPEDLPFKGLIKVFVVPPRRLRLPVLPAKWDDRLLFSLCRTCSIQNRESCANSDEYACTHTDEQRGWVTTTTHLELEEALRNGYVVTHFDRAYHWEQWTDDLFKGYIKEFMAMKLQATGWPDDCTTQEQCDEFIRQNEERYGIKLDPAKMVKNNLLCRLAKAFLNMLWGRFSLRPNLAKYVVTESSSKYFDIIGNDKNEVHTVEMVSSEAVGVTYSSKDDFVREGTSFNLFLSIFTTSAARLKLYEIMRAVADAEGCKLLYTDTDSVIFRYDKSKPFPLQTGSFLGELTDETKGKEIMEFVCAGSKAYCLMMRDKKNHSEISYQMKLRGITLSAETARVLHFESFKEQVLSFLPLAPSSTTAIIYHCFLHSF